AGFSSWEGHPGPSAVAISANAHGVGTNGTDVAPPRVSSPGPIALADYDGDGTLDLFVGGRAIPGAYPKPPSSSLYRNVGGSYVMDTVNTRTLADIGMVSAAMFADIDGDG